MTGRSRKEYVAFSEYSEAHLRVLEQALAREADDEVRERILDCIKQLKN